MARVILLSATPADDTTPDHWRSLEGLRQSAGVDVFRAHELTNDGATADVILFAESHGTGWHFERVRRHPLTRQYREKCFIFSSNPFVIPFLPGVYTSIGRRWASRRVISGFYVGQPRNQFATFTPPTPDLPLLYSFIGSPRTAAVRRELAALEHPRGSFQDTAADFVRAMRREMSTDELCEYYRRYAERIRASKFVLCPRGMSVSSIRLFETMQMGRVPVILSDDWIAPPGPCWEKFALRVAEKDVAKIPRLLEEREADAIAMGELARAQWQEWFSEEVAFHRVVEWCLTLKARRRIPEKLARWPAYLQYLRPFHFRRALGTKWKRARAGLGLANAAREISA